MSSPGAFTIVLPNHQHLIRCGTAAAGCEHATRFFDNSSREILVGVGRRPFSNDAHNTADTHQYGSELAGVAGVQARG